jgi:hypothetical protein
MAMHKQEIILVGHGGIPKGCPLEAQRRTAQEAPSSET